MTREKELQQKGYRIYSIYNFMQAEDAKGQAAQLRKDGYRATVVKTSTSVKGIHSFSVWYKNKQGF